MLLPIIFFTLHTAALPAGQRTDFGWIANANVVFKAGKSEVGFTERLNCLTRAVPKGIHIQFVHIRTANDVNGIESRPGLREGTFAEVRVTPGWTVAMPSWEGASFMPRALSDALKFDIPTKAVGKANFTSTISGEPATGSVWFVETKEERQNGAFDIWKFTVSSKSFSVKGEVEINQQWNLASKLHLTVPDVRLPGKSGKKGTLDVSYALVGFR